MLTLASCREAYFSREKLLEPLPCGMEFSAGRYAFGMDFTRWAASFTSELHRLIQEDVSGNLDGVYRVVDENDRGTFLPAGWEPPYYHMVAQLFEAIGKDILREFNLKPVRVYGYGSGSDKMFSVAVVEENNPHARGFELILGYVHVWDTYSIIPCEGSRTDMVPEMEVVVFPFRWIPATELLEVWRDLKQVCRQKRLKLKCVSGHHPHATEYLFRTAQVSFFALALMCVYVCACFFSHACALVHFLAHIHVQACYSMDWMHALSISYYVSDF